MARSREFDTDQTLDRCLGLFWAKGFDGVSISELEQATGLGRQSLYAAFGNKEQLFAAVLDRYSVHSDAMLAPLLGDGAGLDDIRAYAASALASQRANQCSGCLIVKTLWDHGFTDERLQKRAQAATRRVRAAFAQTIERAVGRGEASAGDATLRADLAFAAINGLAALRRAGVSEARALASLDPLLESWRS